MTILTLLTKKFGERSAFITLSKRIIQRELNHRILNSSNSGYKHFYREYVAVHKLIHRSGFQNFQLSHLISRDVRSVYTSQRVLNKKDPNDNKQKNDDDDKDDSKLSLASKVAVWLMGAFVFMAYFSQLFPTTNKSDTGRYISWNEFVHHILAKGEVERLVVHPELEIVNVYLYDNAIIKGRRTDSRMLHMHIVEMEKFDEKLRIAEARLGIRPEHGVQVIYERNQSGSWLVLFLLVAASLAILTMFRSGTIKPPQAMDMFSQLTRAKFTMVDPLTGGKGVLFKDVAGLKEAKIEVIEFVDYLKRPEFYKNLGAKVPRGALLLGPPGCGKTLLAKAVATEANVPFLAMAGSEFVEMIGGLGAARVRDLFKEARKRAPCIIYIDEIDAIGRKRSASSGESGQAGEEEHTLNQLLVEMDGIATKEGVLLLASTNRSEVLDKALLRPGRFDRHILIDLPTLEERKEIFELHLNSIQLEHPPTSYSARLAQLTPRFSGADIANVCNEAALHAARTQEKKVALSNLSYAVERVVGGTEKRTQVMSAEEKRIVAYHESGHALVAWMLKHTDAMLKISIVPRTNYALGFAQYVPADKHLYAKDELFERMCMLLGGRVAESLVFNRVTSGAEDDLKKVTKMASSQVKEHGMSDTVGHLSFDVDQDSPFGKKPYSKQLGAIIDQEVMKLISQAYRATEGILQANMGKLALIAEALLKKETLSYEEMEALIGPPPHGKKRLVAPVSLAELEAENSNKTPTNNIKSS